MSIGDMIGTIGSILFIIGCVGELILSTERVTPKGVANAFVSMAVLVIISRLFSIFHP